MGPAVPFCAGKSLKRGLAINLGKTFVMCSKESGGSFRGEGKEVKSHGPTAV